MYGLEAIADSYQVSFQPKNTLKVAEIGLQKQPDNIRLIKLAYYAALDINEHEKIVQYLEQLSALQPVWKYSPNSIRRKENAGYRDLLLTKAMHYAYINQLETAQIKLQQLLSDAPGNNDYRSNLSTVYRWRGWLDLSQQELDMIFATDPNYLPARVSEAYNLIGANDFTLAERKIDHINKQYYKQVLIKRLNDDWEISNASIIRFDTNVSEPEGSAFSSKDHAYNLSWYSSPLYYDWRVFYKRRYRSAVALSLDGSWLS